MTHAEVTTAHGGTRIAAVDKASQVRRIRSVILDTYALRDVSPAGEAELSAAVEVVLAVVESHADARLTFEDVALALREGVSGNLDKSLSPDVRPCGANFVRWISAYIASPQMANVRLRGQVGATPDGIPRRLLTPEETDRLNDAAEREAIDREWKVFQRTGNLDHCLLDGYCDVMYRALCRLMDVRWAEGAEQRAEEEAVRQLRVSRLHAGDLRTTMAVVAAFGDKVRMRRNRILLGWYFDYAQRNGIKINVLQKS